MHSVQKIREAGKGGRPAGAREFGGFGGGDVGPEDVAVASPEAADPRQSVQSGHM